MSTKTIIEELGYMEMLEETKIAYRNPENEEFVTLYPEGADFELM
ncbi:hypothetical protein AB4Y30_04325 [Ornithinibacillus sp. 4-3]|uniref:Uncharacterized protein n=1 Tax=Ornithinibacillus sp. 4-3 TaxID=3231488 RepID=A0AB39HTB5_9BACI